MKEQLLSKFTSGRFILTVTSAVVFAVLSIKRILPPEDVEKILLIIVYAYFTQHRPNGKEKHNDKSNSSISSN